MQGFVCQGCGNCCRLDGQVQITEFEIDRLAVFLGLTAHEFIRQYTRLARDRTGLVLTDQADGSCIFLADNRCRVNPVKPRQCVDFPTAWNNPGWEASCQAMSD